MNIYKHLLLNRYEIARCDFSRTESQLNASLNVMNIFIFVSRRNKSGSICGNNNIRSIFGRHHVFG